MSFSRFASSSTSVRRSFINTSYLYLSFVSIVRTPFGLVDNGCGKPQLYRLDVLAPFCREAV
jgi:hypothetical protein